MNLLFGGNLIGVIDLKDCIEVVDRRPMKGYDHVFDLRTDKRAYHFAASSVEVKSVWIESLTAVLRNNTEVYASISVYRLHSKWHIDFYSSYVFECVYVLHECKPISLMQCILYY